MLQVRLSRLANSEMPVSIRSDHVTLNNRSRWDGIVGFGMRMSTRPPYYAYPLEEPSTYGISRHGVLQVGSGFHSQRTSLPILLWRQGRHRSVHMDAA